MELWESLVLPRFYKWGVVKTRQASHGLTETRQKGHWKMMLYQGGEREKYTHLRWVDMCKWQRMIPRHKGSPRYRIAHGWKTEYGSFNLEALNFLMHFREPGSSLYFYFYTYSSFFLFFSSFFLSFFLFLIHFFFSFFLIKFFICSPLNSKIASYLPPPPCLDVARPRAKRR
jgi:cellulose synthase/poly-beta-1,6-N-acetylglucosamine synthase-like glycosyltransferase